ncbi:ABC transporter substrate-binding protein [Arthrobacter sp. I2-34]|uniref:ABC transporter substrate-binding protein n=1 Tax=Arthrobacter hankyongi TaxID=2904801 RepID=A0ABS9L8H7_9MICC|nr:ABC transporter substrate-binding protein [Arthrobacter hankyongi]MCG2622981.1 ABC transporter substrate-binding protein [Arthrobacter hankyongi]
MLKIHRTVLAGVITLAVALTGTACSAGTTSAAGIKSEDGTTAVTVSLPPIVDTAPVYIALEKGLFKKHGLDVKVAATPSMAASIPAVVSGASQFGILGAVDVMQASAAGLPLKMIGNTTVTTDKPLESPEKVYVAKDSSIKAPTDLNGKTIAVSGLGGAGELSLRAALDKSGADSDKIKFLEVPLDSMLDSLKRGQVDAINTISPFTNAAEKSGARYLFSAGAEAVPNALQFVLTTSAKFMEQNPKTVEDFRAALDEATTYAAENPDAVRKILPTFSGTPKELAEVMQLPVFSTDFSVKRARIWSDLMTDYGFVKGNIDINSLVVPKG